MLVKKSQNGLCDCHLLSPDAKFKSACDLLPSVEHVKTDGEFESLAYKQCRLTEQEAQNVNETDLRVYVSTSAV
jgi:hypothetical protein